MTWQKSKGQQSESIYADVFYRLAYATPEEQKNFIDAIIKVDTER